MKNPRFKLGIEQHGDLESIEFWEGLSQGFRNLAIELHNTECRMNETIVVCHSEPGAWYPPLYQTLSSPPTGHGEFMHTIGRTMFETDRNNTECRMNETIVAPPTGHGEFMHTIGRTMFETDRNNTECRMNETIVAPPTGHGEFMHTIGRTMFETDRNNTEGRMNETIVVGHSEPGALFQTHSCPPTGYGEFMYTIGRTMFETDRLNSDHVSRCNQMDFVWVPTEFHVSTFVESGVDPSKVVKIVQPVDVSFFDPLKYKPYDLASIGELVLGRKNARSNSREEFVFLSVFKWEYRKGWDVLLRAYLKEFSSTDGVSLYLLTNAYHSDGDFGNKIMEFVEGSGIEKPATGWSPIYVMDTHIAQVDLPRVYAAADAFVLPSRGEGWGRPLVEAMAMSLPVIATNWSGPTEYLTDENSYPLPVERMSEVKEGAFRGHMWAEPGVDQLGGLMRYVVSNPEEARGKGRKAREDMISRFSPEIVAGIVTDHLQHILGNK